MEEKLFGDIRWHVDGTSPEVGFDSPNFAFFVLRQEGRLPRALANTPSGDVSSQTLKNAFPPTDGPRFGDLAFHPGGFVMFRFVDESGRPFVAGMTPLGILALTPEFASPVEYRQIERRRDGCGPRCVPSRLPSIFRAGETERQRLLRNPLTWAPP